ncbi:MAG: lysophospholipid acyltransferase family protein [Paracoccaceae bacterium]|nr:lysophospholipid acyltransferase family protein [Paracoccaceae bacterium]
MGKNSQGRVLRDWLVDFGARAILRTALILPYTLRVRLVGFVFSAVLAPLAGWRRRIRSNLKIALPDLPESEVRRIERRVPDNVGRTLIEIYSGDEFVARSMDSPVEGPGIVALEESRAAGRPVVLVTAHIGNYDAVRGKLAQVGYPMAALYKPMRNRLFNSHYVEAISTIAKPVFPTNKRGIIGFVRHLKNGGMVGIVADVSSAKSPVLNFFGRPAHTPLSAAEWAVEYDAVMIPIFGLRCSDGVSFRIHVAEQIPHGAPEDMMQRYNDVVEAIVRENVDQWFWIHRRWKGAGGDQ